MRRWRWFMLAVDSAMLGLYGYWLATPGDTAIEVVGATIWSALTVWDAVQLRDGR